MNRYARAGTFIFAMTMLIAGTARAADDITLTRDMTSVIALLGLPCGKAVAVVKQGENDHLVTCQDGNRYRVYLNAEGRVVAEKK